MVRRSRVASLCLFLCAALALSAATLPPRFAETELAGGLNPTGMAIAPDGALFVAEKDGVVRVVRDGSLNLLPFASLEVDNQNERGLLRVAIAPDFAQNPYVYVFYTTPEPALRSRVSRFTANGDSVVPGSEVVLFETERLPGSVHNGGALLLLGDYLFVSTGDSGQPPRAQELDSALGKIHRLHLDGSIPADNPFVGQAGALASIWAYGFRNPFTLEHDAATDRIFVNDVGADRWEEINLLARGGNYGWPLVEGPSTDGGSVAPVHAYEHDAGCAITGGTFYRPAVSSFPAEYAGVYFFADYCNGRISYLEDNGHDDHAHVAVFAEGVDRCIDLDVGPDGALYYLARGGLGDGSEGDNTGSANGAIYRVTYTGTQAPSIARPPRDQLASVGETVTFSVRASGTEPLTYQWQRDGAELTGATGSTLTVGPVEAGDEGAEFACTVTNAFGEVTSAVARLAVTSNARPVAEILTPASGTRYRGGDVLSFSGRGLDAEDGTLPAASLTWKIDFHHDDHLHPAMAPRTGLAGGTYAIPRSGEVSANVWFRLHLTVTDSEGLSATTTRDVHPRTVELRLRTEPPGLRFYLDGAPAEEALTVAAVTGVERTLFAPHPQILEGIGYRFTGWAHGGAQTQTLVAPETDTTYVATFAPDAAALGDGLRGEYFADTDEFSGSPDLVRVDETIDFRWGFEGPGEGLGVDNFAVRWTGQLLPAYSETYTFTTNSDDGVRLWVDDQLLIDRWQPQGERAYAGTLRLEGGRRYPIRLEYFDNLGAAVAELRWNSTHEPFGPIPRERLFSEPVVLHVETLDGAAGEEGDQTARWGLRRSGPREAPLPVSYHFEGLAEEGVDYTVVRPSPEPFAAGVESVEWFVTVLPDDLAEGPEHAALVVAPDIAYGFHDDGRATMIFSDSVRGQWWVERFGGRTEANAPAAAEEADSDGDGWSNLLEYALDTDPLAPPADWRPAIALTPVDGQDYWVFSLERDSDVPPDVRLLLEVAAAPEGPWAEARALPGEAETLPDGRMRIAWRDVQPAATGERRFFRLKLVDR